MNFISQIKLNYFIQWSFYVIDYANFVA